MSSEENWNISTEGRASEMVNIWVNIKAYFPRVLLKSLMVESKNCNISLEGFLMCIYLQCIKNLKYKLRKQWQKFYSPLEMVKY